jgi:hypothetical protein
MHMESSLFYASSCLVAMNERISHLEGVFSRSNLDCLVSFVYALNDSVLHVKSMKLYSPQIEKVALESYIL